MKTKIVCRATSVKQGKIRIVGLTLEESRGRKKREERF